MPGRQRVIREDTRFRVLRMLEENPELSQREFAAAVGISTGSAHYLLSALVERVLVKLGNFTASDDKRRYAYILTPGGVNEKTAITSRSLSRKLEEYEALKHEVLRLEAELKLEELSDMEEFRK